MGRKGQLLFIYYVLEGVVVREKKIVGGGVPNCSIYIFKKIRGLNKFGV